MEVKIKKISKNAIMPCYATTEAAGADLYALCDDNIINIRAGETVLIHTGLTMEIPSGYVGLIYARSGLASKKGLAPANKVGVIDSDYRGEIMIALHNHGESDQVIENGERIAQIVITPYLKCSFVETVSLEESERGIGGFGSTGNK